MRIFQKIIFAFFLLWPAFVLGSELPFTDVSLNDSYYADLKHMYDGGVIVDTADNLFRPNGLLPRDEFVGIVIGVSCHRCVQPTREDIFHFTLDPFVDIIKKNQYFYCISYGKEQGIVRGYVLDNTGNVQCQNKKNYQEVPFCPANNITRIEAAAVLLRQAGLWSEYQNDASYDKKIVLEDVDAYWYGYAQKAVEAKLITVGMGNKIAPNEYISRKEFVVMASKIFSMNMCNLKDDSDRSDFAALIKIFDKEKNQCKTTDSTTLFPNSEETVYDFGGYINGNPALPIQYVWEFTNMTTGEKKNATGNCINNFDLQSPGTWRIKLTMIDANNRTSTVYQQIFVKKPGSPAVGISKEALSLQIGLFPSDYLGKSKNHTRNDYIISPELLKVTADTLRGVVGIPMPFFSHPKGGDGNYSYYWDFSDGATAFEKNPVHIFMKEGIYPVSLTVRDTSGNIAYAELIVIIVPNLDRDNDGVLDYTSSKKVLDKCPLVVGPISNAGCPRVDEYNYNTSNSTLGNICLENKVRTGGMIEGSVQCTSCPCQYSSEFIAKVRGCDIIFPVIASPDKKTLYSRGSIFAVP